MKCVKSDSPVLISIRAHTCAHTCVCVCMCAHVQDGAVGMSIISLFIGRIKKSTFARIPVYCALSDIPTFNKTALLYSVWR